MDEEAVYVENGDVLHEVDDERFEGVFMVPVSYFVGKDSDYLVFVVFEFVD